MGRQKPREIAVRLLGQAGRGPDYLEQRLDAALAGQELSGPDRALTQELVCGVTRWQATLDWLVARRAPRPPSQPLLQNLLRLGLYQLFWLNRIPDHAAVGETVALARELGFGAQAGFVNALLRGYARDRPVTQQALAELRTTNPALGYSHPAWLVARWTARWGEARAAKLMEWNNTPPRNYARVNMLRADPGRLLDQWRQEGVEYDFGQWDWVPENSVFSLKAHPPLTRLASFQQGWFYVQDPSTLLAAGQLGAQPGETVLDCCAAPGGKTTLIAQAMRNQGRLLAQEISEERLDLVRENCARLGLTCVEPTLAPGPAPSREPPPGPAPDSGLCDRVLVDAPCSNSGVMRRRVELRWRLRPEELLRLRALQLALLEQAGRRLRPGGTLVYSTCSLEPEENETVVREFLAGHPGLRLEQERQLLPFVEGVDGAYVATLRRTITPC